MKLIAYQQKHNRLVWQSLYNWDKEKADTLLDWFKENIANIAQFCFSRGLARDKKDWAQYVWYINLLGEEDLDGIFSVEAISKAAENNLSGIYPSKMNGGSTTQLPFGFVQWHQQQMQFHHSLKKLLKIVDSTL